MALLFSSFVRVCVCVFSFSSIVSTSNMQQQKDIKHEYISENLHKSTSHYSTSEWSQWSREFRTEREGGH
jgi:hypothetical protein